MAFFAPGIARSRGLVLIVASLVFYGFSGIEHAIILITGIIWVYLVTYHQGIKGNKNRLALAVIPPALALVYYKYTTFLLVDVLHLTKSDNPTSFDLYTNIILPAGISFFTFQLISYAIDRYRQEIETPPQFINFALYVSFFPQLVAGPILRFRKVTKPLKNLSIYRLNEKDLKEAIGYIATGLAIKVLVADTLGGFIDPMVDAPGELSPVSSLYVVLSYSFQIYFDFYGYSLIAIGLGRLFGFHFPTNFNRPYAALNIKDFWRRWHITLSYWIRDYLYIPLGGNRAYKRNILIVFGLCGLWHGAGWNFIIWGLYHGALTGLYNICEKWWLCMPRLIQISLNFTLVSLGWVLFLFDFDGVTAFMKSLVGLSSTTVTQPDWKMWLMLTLAAVVCFGPRLEPFIEFSKDRRKFTLVTTIGLAGVFVFTLIFIDRSNTFIYFRF